MADGFGTFNLGNVLTQAENIKGLRSQNVLREQQISSANTLAQRNAQGQVLLQNFLAEQGGPAGGAAFNQLAGFAPELAEQAQGLVESRFGLQQEQETAQRESEQREIDEATRLILLIKQSDNPAEFSRLVGQTALDQIGDAEGFDTSNLDDEDTLQLADNLLLRLGPRSSLSLEELGIGRDTSNIIQFQGPGGEIQEVRADSPEADQLAADPNFNRVGIVQRVLTEEGPVFPTKGAEAEFKTDVGNFNSTVRSAEQLIQTLQESPDAVTTTAAIAAFGNRVKTEAEAVSRQFGFGVDSIDETLERFSRNNGKGGVDPATGQSFDPFEAAGLAGARAEVKAGILSLALFNASVLGLGKGRELSDKDVERAMISVTGGAVDPDIISRVTQSTLRNIRFRIEERAKVNEVELTGNLALREFQPFGAVPETVAPVDENTDEALKRRLGLPQ